MGSIETAITARTHSPDGLFASIVAGVEGQQGARALEEESRRGLFLLVGMHFNARSEVAVLAGQSEEDAQRTPGVQPRYTTGRTAQVNGRYAPADGNGDEAAAKDRITVITRRFRCELGLTRADKWLAWTTLDFIELSEFHAFLTLSFEMKDMKSETHWKMCISGV